MRHCGTAYSEAGVRMRPSAGLPDTRGHPGFNGALPPAQESTVVSHSYTFDAFHGGIPRVNSGNAPSRLDRPAPLRAAGAAVHFLRSPTLLPVGKPSRAAEYGKADPCRASAEVCSSREPWFRASPQFYAVRNKSVCAQRLMVIAILILMAVAPWPGRRLWGSNHHAASAPCRTRA